MSRLVPSLLASLLLVCQASAEDDPPARHVPLKPATRQELDHVEALKLYGIGVMHEQQNRLIEALHTFEEARRLDPDSAAIERTLIPLYCALDRLDDALSSCRRVLELEPDDYETGYRYARQLRTMGKTKEALAVLTKTAGCPGLKDNLEIRAQIFYDLGQLQEDAGELDKAEKSLREVLSILDNPAALMEQGPYNRDEIVTQAAETYERLGRLYLKAKKPAEAIDAFQRAMKKDNLRTPRLTLNLAEVFAAQGQADRALTEIEQYLRSLPQGMEGYELRIKLQRELGREADVLTSLERSAGADRNNPALQLLLAREYVKTGRAGQAEPIYRKLLGQTPTADAYRGLFQVYKSEGSGGAERLLTELDQTIKTARGEDRGTKEGPPDEAQREAAQRAATQARAMLIALREDGDLIKLLLSAATRRLTTRIGLGYTTSNMLASVAGRARQFREAELLFRYCLDHPHAINHEQELYSGLLTILSLAHKNQAILDECNKGLKKAQNTNRLLFLGELAVTHMAMNHVRDALTAADEAVQTAGSAEEKLRCRRMRAQLLSQAERQEQAIAECQALLKEYNQPGDVHAIRSVLSGIYSTAHQYEKAEEQLLLILKDDPDDATANNDLGYLWADQSKKLEEAEKRIRRALELDRRQRNSIKNTSVDVDADRDNAAFVDSLGWLLFRKGDWVGGRRELERASALPGGDDDPVVWDHLGDVCFRLKDAVKAGEAWRRAIELYESGGRRRPDDRYKEIKEKLQSLSRDG